jgi:hypothetical protein
VGSAAVVFCFFAAGFAAGFAGDFAVEDAGFAAALALAAFLWYSAILRWPVALQLAALLLGF